jgi:hypothetical protein
MSDGDGVWVVAATSNMEMDEADAAEADAIIVCTKTRMGHAHAGGRVAQTCRVERSPRTGEALGIGLVRIPRAST